MSALSAMNAAENDVAGISLRGLEGEFEGIAAKIGELDDFIALVMMAEDDHVFAQAVFCGSNTLVEGVIGDEQVGVKVATDPWFNFWRANSSWRLRTDKGAAFRDGN